MGAHLNHRSFFHCFSLLFALFLPSSNEFFFLTILTGIEFEIEKLSGLEKEYLEEARKTKDFSKIFNFFEASLARR